jgi:mRNA-degrading endonuclease toxin of MazEF toxin-antitoxin module
VSVTPERGEVWRYQAAIARPGQSTLRLIVSAAPINHNASLPTVLALHVFPTDPGGLLAVGLGELGWTTAMSIEATMRSRLTELLAVVDADTMDLINAALRSAQDL